MKRKPFFILIPIVILFVASAVVMLLWNCILPIVFAIKAISYWQAMGILVLSKLLFGGFCFGKRHRHHPPFFGGKWMSMSEEERQQFKDEWEKRKENWRNRWC